MTAHKQRVHRVDAGATLAKPRRLSNGFLEVDAILSRTGVYEYPDARLPGGIRREMRLPEEVFAPLALEGFRGTPVTQEHPPDQLTPENVTGYGRGTVITSARRDGDNAIATLVIHDKVLADEVESGERDGVSPGYFLDLEPAPPGTHVDGVEIHAYQRNIAPNHTAIVKYPRGGDRVRVHRGDGKQARMDGFAMAVEDGSTPAGGTPPSGENMTTAATSTSSTPMRTINVDGISGDVPPHLAQAYERQQQERVDAEKKHATDKAELEKKVTAERARADGLADEKKKLEEEKKRMDAELAAAKDPKAVAARVKERVALERVATKALGAAVVKLDSGEKPLGDMEDGAIRLAVMRKRVPGFALDGIKEDQRDFYLTARFTEEATRIDAEKAAAAEHEDAEEMEGEDVDEPVDDAKARTDSSRNEPRTFRGDGTTPGAKAPARAERKDARESFLEERNLAGLLPSERKRLLEQKNGGR